MHFSKIEAVLLAFGAVAFARVVVPSVESDLTGPTDHQAETLWATALKKAQNAQTSNIQPTCKWFGTSPFCSPQCPRGWHEVQRDSKGDGGLCVTGDKKLCCDDATYLKITAAVESESEDPSISSHLLQAPIQKSEHQNFVESSETDFEIEIIVSKKESKHEASAAGDGCAWYGTAPICKGYCPSGQRKWYEDASGPRGGNYCFSGKKWYCCPLSVPFPGEGGDGGDDGRF